MVDDLVPRVCLVHMGSPPLALLVGLRPVTTHAFIGLEHSPHLRFFAIGHINWSSPYLVQLN